MSATLDLTKLEGITLERGAHSPPEEGKVHLCLMEAFAYARGLPHTDRPPCVCPSLGEYGRKLNDLLGDEQRQQLTSMLPLLLDTNEIAATKKRVYFLADRAVRLFAPASLRAVGLESEATKLEALPEVVDQKSAYAAESAAEHAARSAARSAAYAAESAAEHAAGSAANAAGSAAGSAANAAGSAAYAANAAGSAANAAWSAAYAANAAGSAAYAATDIWNLAIQVFKDAALIR